MFKEQDGGEISIIKRKRITELVEDCVLYKPGDASAGYEMGLLPHIYSCKGRNVNLLVDDNGGIVVGGGCIIDGDTGEIIN